MFVIRRAAISGKRHRQGNTPPLSLRAKNKANLCANFRE
jgi:hypothetical protein